MKKVFLFIFCSYLLFFVLIPPFQSPDEVEHYETTFWVSQFKWPFIPTRNKAFKIKYQTGELAKTFDSGDLTNPYVLPNFSKIENSTLRQKPGYSKKEINKFDQYSSNSYHPPIVFFLSSIPLHIANLFKSDIVTRFYMARLIPLILFYGTIFFVYHIFRQFFKDSKIIASLLIFYGLNPLLLSNNSGINPDNAVIFFSAFFFYVFLRFVKKEIGYLQCFVLGMICGIATLSKLSGLTNLGFICLIILIKYRINLASIKRLIIIISSWIIITTPWFLMNFLRYEKPIVDNFTIAPRYIEKMNMLTGSVASVFEFRHTFMHFSGFVGWNETHGPKIFFISYAIIFALLILIGIIKLISLKNKKLNYLLIYFSLFMVFLFFVGLNFKLLGVAWDIQGRYLLPAFFVIPVIIAYGLSHIIKKPIEIAGRIMMVWAVVHYYYILLFVLLAKYYV